MHILVTGGAGFIGSHTAKRLLQLGHRVTVIDNFDPYYQRRLKDYHLQSIGTGYDLEVLDLRHTHKLNALMQRVRPDAIIHLAAKAGVRNSVAHPSAYVAANVMGTVAILEAARATGIRKLIIASSSSVYGDSRQIPFTESDPVLNQVSPYASSKRAMEVICQTYASTYPLSIQLLRFFTVYGPGGRPDMAPVLFTKAIDTGSPITIFGTDTSQRDYTYIDDIVDGIVGALGHEDAFAIYNLGNNTPVSLREFITTIESHLGKKANLHFGPARLGDVERTWADITRAQAAFGYRPRHTLQDGMKKFVAWYQEHRDLYA